MKRHRAATFCKSFIHLVRRTRFNQLHGTATETPRTQRATVATSQHPDDKTKTRCSSYLATPGRQDKNAVMCKPHSRTLRVRSQSRATVP
jgi:hypothetical protein